MVGILLMSHGRMAEGMLDSSKLFFGDDIPQIKALCLMASDNPEEFDEKIRAAVEEIDDGQGVIAMCDLLGGTPCNRSALVLNDRLQVITGMNFSILSLKNTSPTLSLFSIAANASVAAISVTISRFIITCVPKLRLSDTSTRSITVSSRSSSNTFE